MGVLKESFSFSFSCIYCCCHNKTSLQTGVHPCLFIYFSVKFTLLAVTNLTSFFERQKQVILLR